MYGWADRIRRVNLSKRKISDEKVSSKLALDFIGGRGFAIKLLWDNLEKGIDPLSPQNILILSIGPLTGLPLPSSGKLVVAAKSPLTGGYGDGNIGSQAAVHMKKANLDSLLLIGKAVKPSYVLIEDNKTEILETDDLWGLGTFETEKRLREEYGKTVGILSIGPAGENLVKYANIISQEGRGGGRPGIGAVMGSKNLKAIVLIGTGEPSLSDSKELKRLAADAYREILGKPNYKFWKRQGTMSVIAWSQENSVLPTYNFREGVFEAAEGIGGDLMESYKITQKGCPFCNMTCGNVIEDDTGHPSELDYENVAMLGSDIGLGDLKKVASLNRFSDDVGIDTISLGNSIGFAMEASEKRIIEETLEWGDFQAVKALSEDIVTRRGLGAFLAEGVQSASEIFGGESWRWAMHVKGLEISAYDCHHTPAMALAYGTSPIGAHHKDAWVIAWEVTVDRGDYGEYKVDKVIELQRLRGGIFESLTTCRLPWIEVGLDLEWYPKFFEAVTGIRSNLPNMSKVADRIYSLIRCFWIRESGSVWNSSLDIPPPRWFEDPPLKGSIKGLTLKKEGYLDMLNRYYKKRGWDKNGIPTRATLDALDLNYAAHQIL
jgi:aldehyde:ferredoxin oxidoreductase